MTKYHIGVDLHKTVAQVCALDDRGEVVREWRAPLADSAAGASLVAELAAFPPPSRVAVEALGCNRWFVNSCRAAGVDVTVVHAAALKLKESGRKTDRRDAAEIARRLYMGDIDKHARSYYATETEYGRRKLLRTRHFLLGRRQEAINQIRALLNAYLLRPPTETLPSKKSLEWLRTLELPTPELTYSLGVFVRDLEHLLGEIKRLDEQIQALAKEPKIAAMVEVLPSVGVLTAATIFYELGDLRRFRNARQVSSYVGLVPRVSQSGEGAAHHGRLDKRGNSDLRWILSQWAVRLMTRDPLAHEWAQRHRRHKPLNKVRTALARRLLVGVQHMLRTGEVFSLSRCLYGKAAAA
jgi:transposase